MPGLALTHLALSHFRSHRRAQLGLPPGPIALHGPNGAGKTNVLEAVSLLAPGRGLRGAPADALVRRPEALGWKIRADLASGHQFHEVETWAEPGAPRQVRIDAKAAPQVTLGRIARILWLVPAMDRLWIEGAEGRRRFLDRMTLSFEPGHAEVSLAYDKAMRDRNRLLRDEIRDDRWYAALETQMGEAGARIRANRAEALLRIAHAQRDAETAFPTADLAIEEHDSETDLAAALAHGRAADMRAGRTLAGPHRADLVAVYTAKGVPAAQCSTGEQKALLVSLVLANARALLDELGAPPILLLDEVAAHLDPGRRAALYDEICALGAQAWMTGTEPGLFADLGARGHYLEVSDEAGESRVKETGAPAP